MPARRRTASTRLTSDRKTKEGPGVTASRTTSADAESTATRPAKRNVIGGAAWLIERTALGGSPSTYTSRAVWWKTQYDRNAFSTASCSTTLRIVSGLSTRIGCVRVETTAPPKGFAAVLSIRAFSGGPRLH